ncbi:MAG TPA: nodulation protein NfeD [Bacilli bacterium]|nr:nodulation protein NfeD [Bacilli bacterium]
MRQRLFRLLLVCTLLLAACCSWLFGTAAQAAGEGEGSVFVIPVENRIETGLAMSLHRAFDQAQAQHAKAIVLDINTLGGEVGAALEIGETIRGSQIPVIAYIRSQAISAGSYIALNATHIAMAPGSTIGAAEARNADGDVADPKVIAFWRSAMTSAAEATGKDGKIAAGMVDRNVVIPGLKAKGELVSLSAEQAVEHKIADGIFDKLDDAIVYYGYQKDLIYTYHPSFSEKVARFLTNPLVIPILLVVGLLGITTELLVTGKIFPGLIGVTSLGLYFFGHMVAGFAGWESVILFAAGIILLVAEIFVTGFGILGGLGVLAMGSGIVIAAYDTTYGLKVLAIAIVLSIVVGIILFKYFGHLGLWNRLILNERQDKTAGYTPTRNLRHMLYQNGKTVTPLRPAGTATFNGQRFDVVSTGEFLPIGTDVQIVLIEGTRIVVRRKMQGETTVIPRVTEDK